MAENICFKLVKVMLYSLLGIPTVQWLGIGKINNAYKKIRKGISMLDRHLEGRNSLLTTDYIRREGVITLD